MADRRFETSDVSEALPIRDKRSKILIENRITTSAFGTCSATKQDGGGKYYACLRLRLQPG